MKLFPVYSLLWSSILVLPASLSETDASQHVCEAEKAVEDLLQVSSVLNHNVEMDAVGENFRCLLYPTNLLNCSWWFDTLHRDARFFVYISVCEENTAVDSLTHLPEENVESAYLTLGEHQALYVILQFNVTLDNKWTLYTYTYDMDMLEVLSPPQNLSASVKDGDLLVTWALPHSRTTSNPGCFEYQLDIGDQEKPKNVVRLLSYKEPNADPSHTYRVRIRTRIVEDCQKNPHWGDWSHAVTVEQPKYKLNTLVIVSISFGIPVIVLALLLLVRYQRMCLKGLFPPIPRPPPRYIYFLEKSDAFNFFLPVLPVEPMEEITEVEETEQNLSKTF